MQFEAPELFKSMETRALIPIHGSYSESGSHLHLEVPSLCGLYSPPVAEDPPSSWLLPWGQWGARRPQGQSVWSPEPIFALALAVEKDSGCFLESFPVVVMQFSLSLSGFTRVTELIQCVRPPLPRHHTRAKLPAPNLVRCSLSGLVYVLGWFPTENHCCLIGAETSQLLRLKNPGLESHFSLSLPPSLSQSPSFPLYLFPFPLYVCLAIYKVATTH